MPFERAIEIWHQITSALWQQDWAKAHDLMKTYRKEKDLS